MKRIDTQKERVELNYFKNKLVLTGQLEPEDIAELINRLSFCYHEIDELRDELEDHQKAMDVLCNVL